MGKIYPQEYRREAVELYRLGGTTYAAVGRKLGVSGEAVRNWVLCRRRHKTQRWTEWGEIPKSSAIWSRVRPGVRATATA